MEHRQGNDQERGPTNKECKKNSSTESEEKKESSSLEEKSEEEVQSRVTELPNIEPNNCIDEEEICDEEEDELVDEERLSEEKEESVNEEMSDEEEGELGAGEQSDEEQEKISPEEISDEEEDESSDEELSGEEEDESKNLKNECMKNFKNKCQVVLAGPNPPPPIPPEFKNCIQEKSWGQGISFSDEILVIQKQLSETEISQPRSRFFIPPDFIRNKHFNDDELDELNNNSFITVTIIDPVIENVTVNLRRKLMIKNIGGEPSRAYILNKDWDRIVTAKNLEEGDILQLWAVRVGGNLCFVLVKLPKEGGESCGENTSISSGCDTRDSEAESPSSTENEDI